MTTPSFEAPQIDELQRLLPAYEILCFIAQGRMGAVYRARQVSLDREVAIKILPREFGGDGKFRESFDAEAKAMAKLNHPNLIAVYDFGEVEDMPYIVMEYVHGKALHYSTLGQCIEQSEAVSLTLGICKGLAHAHEEGILHRDIKAANILLDPEKQPKIGNFGLACAINSEANSAPEALHSPDEIDKRSDVYSIGILFYQLLTGELPTEPYVPVSRKVSVHPSIDQFIRRAIHPSPSHRFSDAGEMATALAKLIVALPKARVVAFNTGRAVPMTGPLATPSARYSPPKSSVHAVGTNWPLLRNLVIIAILLVAIFFVHDELKERQQHYNTPSVQSELPQMEPMTLSLSSETEASIAPSKSSTWGEMVQAK